MSHWTLVRNRNPYWVVLRVSHWQNRSAGGGAEVTPCRCPWCLRSLPLNHSRPRVEWGFFFAAATVAWPQHGCRNL